MTELLTRTEVPIMAPAAVDAEIPAAQCPAIPDKLTFGERQRVLGVCVVENACSGPRTGVSGRQLCCKGVRDSIEMRLKADDIAAENKRRALAEAEALRIASALEQAITE